VGRISPNGLLEVNRQRIQQDLHLRTHRACPTCVGTGRIASSEMVGLKILRKIEARAAAGFTGTVRISLHPELADSIQNKRRRELSNLEDEFSCRVEVIASNRLHRSEEEVEWIEAKEGEFRVPKTPRAGTGAARESLSIEDASSPEDSSSGTKKAAPKRRRRRPPKSSEKAARGRDARSTDTSAAPSPAETSPSSPGAQSGDADQSTAEKSATGKRRRGGRGRSRRGGRKRKPADTAKSPGTSDSPS